MTEKQALKIHGYVASSDSDDLSDSDSGKSEFDDKYYALRPPPVPLQGLENRIVKIKAPDLAATNNCKKDCNEGKVLNYPIQQNTILEQKASQRETARPTQRRGQVKSNQVIPSTTTNGPKSEEIQKTVNYTNNHPFSSQTSVWQNRNKPMGKLEHRNRMQSHPQHFQAEPAFYNKERPFNDIRDTKPTSEWFDISNSSQQKFVDPKNSKYIASASAQSMKQNHNPPNSTAQKPLTFKENSYRDVRNELVKCTGAHPKHFNRERTLQVQNFYPCIGTSITPILVTNSANTASTSTNLNFSENLNHTTRKVVTSIDKSQREVKNISTAIVPTGIISLPANSSRKKKSSTVQNLRPVNTTEPSVKTNLPIFTTNTTKTEISKGANLNSIKDSKKQTESSSNEIKSYNGSIFPIFSNEVPINNEATRVMGRNWEETAPSSSNEIKSKGPILTVSSSKLPINTEAPKVMGRNWEQAVVSNELPIVDETSQVIGRNQQLLTPHHINAVTNEPIPVFLAERSLHSNDVVRTTQQEDATSRKNLPSRIFDAVKNCFCCKVEESYSQF